MNKRFIKKWAAVLRSGKFKQARSALKNGDALCCIGVGYVVAKGRRPAFESTHAAAKAIGLTDGQQTVLVNMNDLKRKDFHAIADWIESKLPAA